MSERNMQLSFMAMFGAILTVLDIVSIIILLIMLMILGNTIAMGVRERTREYAVLRAIGFQPGHIRLFVLGEATALGIVAGLVGVGIAYPFVNNVMGRAVEENMSAWFPYFRVEPGVALSAIGIAVLLATTAALIPAIQAGRISVTDALRKIG
jgi:putative ABC transport system permease protein